MFENATQSGKKYEIPYEFKRQSSWSDISPSLEFRNKKSPWAGRKVGPGGWFVEDEDIFSDFNNIRDNFFE